MARQESVLGDRVGRLQMLSLDDLQRTNRDLAALFLAEIHAGRLPHYSVQLPGTEAYSFLLTAEVAHSFCASREITVNGVFDESIVSFPETDLQRWQQHTPPSYASELSQSPLAPELPELVGLIRRGVSALERIAGAVERFAPAVPSSASLSFRDSLNPLVTAVRHYWEQEGYVADKKIRIRGIAGDTYCRFHDPVSIDDAARSVEMTPHWIICRLNAGTAAEQDFFEWQRRAHKGRSSVAAQTILYFALTQRAISSRMLVAHAALYVFHAPLDDVRTAGTLAGLTGTNHGDSYSTVVLRERLVLPVAQYALKQYAR